jgi:hypothetical protein
MKKMGEQKRETILRFRLPVTNGHEAFDRFFPNGQQVLNRAEWRGKEPRSCAVTGFRSNSTSIRETDKGRELLADIEVTYRPKGWITYTGDTRYDAWTLMMLDRRADGTLLDGHGNQLPHGAQPVYLPFEVYTDVDFNTIDFGEFVGEFETKSIGRIAYDDFMQQVKTWTRFDGSLRSTFVVPRRQRPMVKVALTDLSLGFPGQGGGTRVLVVNKESQNVEQLLLESLMEVMSGFFEGRYALKTLSNGTVMFVELSDAVIELKAGREETKLDTLFGVFSSYVSASMLEDLAKRLMSVYEVELTIVEGEQSGFIVSRGGSERE